MPCRASCPSWELGRHTPLRSGRLHRVTDFPEQEETPMTPRAPEVLIFDVNETLSDMAPMAGRFRDVGVPGEEATSWFAALLRDGFAPTAAGGAGDLRRERRGGPARGAARQGADHGPGRRGRPRDGRLRSARRASRRAR